MRYVHAKNEDKLYRLVLCDLLGCTLEFPCGQYHHQIET
jgi:hypothetical protein